MEIGTIKIHERFKQLGEVSYDRDTNELRSSRYYGNQSTGTLLWLEVYCDIGDGRITWSREGPAYWVPALHQWEPNTLNNGGGGMGAYRDIPNEVRVQEIREELRDRYPDAEIVRNLPGSAVA